MIMHLLGCLGILSEMMLLKKKEESNLCQKHTTVTARTTSLPEPPPVDLSVTAGVCKVLSSLTLYPTPLMTHLHNRVSISGSRYERGHPESITSRTMIVRTYVYIKDSCQTPQLCSSKPRNCVDINSADQLIHHQLN